MTREEWLQQRKKSIGASESAAVMGLSKWASPYSVWASKTSDTQATTDEGSEAMHWGTVFEAPIADRYAAITGRTLTDAGRYAIIYHPQFPFLSCTLDRRIVAFDDRGEGVLEIKTAGHVHKDEWAEEPPLPYLCQLMHQLAVTGLKWGSLAVLIGGQQLRYQDVPRNENFISLLIEKCTEFWHLVETRVQPPIDSSAATYETLKRLHPLDNGETVELPPESCEWLAQIRTAKEMHAEAKKLEEENKNKLLAAIGDCTYANFPSGDRYSYRTSNIKEYIVAARTQRVLRDITPKERR